MRTRAVFQRFSENEWSSTLIVKPNYLDEGPEHHLAFDVTLENVCEPDVRIKASLSDLYNLLEAQVNVPLVRSQWTVSIDGFPSFQLSQKQMSDPQYQDCIADALEVWKEAVFTNRLSLPDH